MGMEWRVLGMGIAMRETTLMVVMMGWGITCGAMETSIEDHSVGVLDTVMVRGRRGVMGLEIPMRVSTSMISGVGRAYLGG